LACMSLEKLVIDAEAIGMAKRMLQGMRVLTPTLATELFEGIDFKGDFLKQRITRKLMKEEQFMPSSIIDRGSIRTWQQQGRTDTFERAKTRVADILNSYQPSDLFHDEKAELKQMVSKLASEAGMDRLPKIE
jgi:trimethylamine--corrinoid protein Co-methyltransferase